MRAVIDIGSNSVLLLVGEREPSGALHVVRDDARIARLSEGVSTTGKLSKAAVERTLAILSDYRVIAEAAGAEIEAVATEGLRMASNQQDFLDAAKQALGTEVRMISGDDEATLSYVSVAREYSGGGALRVVDIGGASTELAIGVGETVSSLVSHKIGSVRLTERHIAHDPPTKSEIDAVERETKAALAQQPLDPLPELHGLAGTVTTAAALLLGLPEYDRCQVDDSRFAPQVLRELRDTLAAESLAVRSKRPCLPAGRADVIVAGLTILLAVLDHCGADTLVVRDRGLRYALL